MTYQPPWARSARDGLLHMIRRYLGDAAEVLCGESIPMAELEEPGGEDQQRCTPCMRAYGAELAEASRTGSEPPITWRRT